MESSKYALVSTKDASTKKTFPLFDSKNGTMIVWSDMHLSQIFKYSYLNVGELRIVMNMCPPLEQAAEPRVLSLQNTAECSAVVHSKHAEGLARGCLAAHADLACFLIPRREHQTLALSQGHTLQEIRKRDGASSEESRCNRDAIPSRWISRGDLSYRAQDIGKCSLY